MSHSTVDRNLLFGILALQNNFINREVLLAAFTAWVVDKQRPLGEILREQGIFDQPAFVFTIPTRVVSWKLVEPRL